VSKLQNLVTALNATKAPTHVYIAGQN
jgi:hypothetical protein